MLNKQKEERIAKLIARAGICSRRKAEELIAQGRVTYKGKKIITPAEKFSDIKEIEVDGKKLQNKKSKLWCYHKPVGLVVSHNDEQGRLTVFDSLPIKERVISIGRLDKNTSGLLLLTNDGEISRKLELPSNNFSRTYLVKIYGRLHFSAFKKSLSNGIVIDSIKYRPLEVKLIKTADNNHLLELTLTEGKNREIRNILKHFDFKISKLIRTNYGPFSLGNLKPGEVLEIEDKILEELLVISTKV